MNPTDLPQHSSALKRTTLTILYFARLKEALGCGVERLDVPAAIADVRALQDYLAARGGAWTAEFASSKPMRVAVNQAMANAETALEHGDEVAFFPPVTGG
ncbi:MAG: molybdopterin converting factor subunit 1 [Betaproteobacteria bacterium]